MELAPGGRSPPPQRRLRSARAREPVKRPDRGPRRMVTFDARPTEIRQLLRGDLDPARTNELSDQMRAAGLPV